MERTVNGYGKTLLHVYEWHDYVREVCVPPTGGSVSIRHRWYAVCCLGLDKPHFGEPPNRWACAGVAVIRETQEWKAGTERERERLER